MSAWYIRTRAEFFEVLDRTIAELGSADGALPEFSPHGSILLQLQAMREWTREGRAPTEEEQDRITIGWFAVRELDAADSEGRASLQERLVQLDGYFCEWPED